SNYRQYVASYLSDGLKIFALLTVPNGAKPASGWPVIIFNHGYIPPTVYRTTERYVAYIDAFARSGYIVFKPDYRGFGSSQGTPDKNKAFWDSSSPMAYLADITAPIQIHHGTADVEVPLQFSQTLASDLKAAGKPVELYTYAGSDHNISQGFSQAMARSVAFF